MKQVLIIFNSIHVEPRILGLVNYLPKFGWQPILLTSEISRHKNLPVKTIVTPYRNALGQFGKILGVKSNVDAKPKIQSRLGVTFRLPPCSWFMRLGGEFVNYPCYDKNWLPFALDAGKQLLSTGDIDAIISTSPPVIAHVIASELKKIFGIVWIADLRDLWSQNHNYGYSRMRKSVDRRLELNTLANADALVTISRLFADRLKLLHKRESVFGILHGFDDRDINHHQLKQTACPCPTKRGETIGSVTGALREMLIAPTKSALEAKPQSWQEKRD